jgi:hypothetical protein
VYITFPQKTTHLKCCTVGGIHNDKKRLPGEREQVSRMKADEEKQRKDTSVSYTHSTSSCKVNDTTTQ